ncbi:FAD-dependent monooxygenase [Actinocrispum wychmicini]|uniref:2-polyprenyl-6-methoxyphenol hydroxylase-like FAD-dependent oxidoreductase n=1 Tax=Actinocrispum wychmicini TaxID=1213861 RepID=A0A4V2S849_9PSEU|nr:FAD-dependent monooxygenase [Actinocrispum wychmicini]TCO62410.1 2-polyprenyl-6-methoxyphenol hydroxylase-like FAD-dependent oxidoreductase [Actinocrispum wychmicini]
MKVVICGAGITGLTLAHRLSGHEVVLLERAPGPRPQGYMIDFFGPGYDALEAMGLLPAVEEIAYHLDEATLLDEHGHRRSAVQYPEFAKIVDGRLMSLMRPDLERVLLENLPSTVDLRFDTSLTAIAGNKVTLDDGTELEADLIVGADGVHSTVRRLVFGEIPLRHLGFHTAAYIFDDPEIHAATVGRFCLTDTVGQQMGLYGLRDGRVAAFAVHRTADPTIPDDIPAALKATYGGLGWLVPRALEKCPSAAEIYYDQVAQVEMPRWSKGNVVLVGDACYAVSLLAGQGASLGIGGAYVLTEQLTTQPLDQALAEYERLWRPVVEDKQKVGRSGAHWFLPKSTMELQLRRMMLRLSRLPMVRRYVAVTLVGKPSTLIRSPAAST